ncbi:MAG: twin-arginine translocation signal domain-containing protein, partial [Candidatus Hydrogenedentota bacterium]
MQRKSFSRRTFMTAAGVGPAAAAATREPVVVSPILMSNVKAKQDPLRIVTMYRFEPEEAARIAAATPDVKVVLTVCKTRKEFQEKLEDAEVVYGGVRGAELSRAPKLRWLQTGGAGVEWMDQALRESAVVVTNYARTFAPGISETTMGLLLCLTRGISKYYIPQFYKRSMKAVGTLKSDHHTELVGRTMGIVGMGGIGTAIARRAYYGFDMKIVGTDAKPSPKPEYVAELHDPGW